MANSSAAQTVLATPHLSPTQCPSALKRNNSHRGREGERVGGDGMGGDERGEEGRGGQKIDKEGEERKEVEKSNVTKEWRGFES